MFEYFVVSFYVGKFLLCEEIWEFCDYVIVEFVLSGWIVVVWFLELVIVNDIGFVCENER